MPLSRYEIRNEYSLADPDLYRAADKDDPEALLEGVAMTGLVGILRQLGDLAEFAAEIFHDLHEDLMATAARGYSLTVRVQQIEAEFPSIEKAFLSQTSHSSFFYNTGVDWHLNVHLNQNLVTQGDLPRFVMDSYEECRGPPRLFLLDKFDVAGAGSCLKRYTDPSFFKAESPLSVMPNAEVQREKKGRKSKKKGSRWRNGETPEVLSTSHVKLQQLLLEERVENHISDPARRVKLKRRLNGSPFNYAMGKSYMDAILKIPPPDLDVVREISITSSPLKMPTSVAAETENEVLEITAINPDKNTQQRKRSTYSSSDSEAGYKPSIHPLTEEYSEISPNFSSTQRGDVLSTPHEVYTKEIISEGVRKKNEYQSDDEVDNYVDALTSMDSEMETDSEYRAKNGTSFLKVNDRGIGSDATEELSDMQTNSTDNHSIGNSSLMDGVNSSSRKEKSTFSYSGSFDLAENTASEGDASANTIQSAEHREAELVNSSSDGYSCNRNTPSTHLQRHIIQDNACNDNGNKNSSSYNSEFGEPSSGSHLSESGIVLLPADPVAHFVEVSSLGLELDKIYSNHSNSRDRYVNNEENSIHLDKSIPWTSNYGDLAFQTEDTGFSKLSLNSIDELNDQGTHKYHASLHLQSVLQLSSDNNRNEDLKNNIMQGEFLEKEDVLNSVASPIQSRSTFSSQKEEHTEKEIETCSLCVVTEENASEGMDCLGTVDLADMQLQDSESNHSVDLGMRFSHSQEVKLDWPSSSRADGEAKDGSSSGNDLVDLVPKNNDETNFASVRNFPYSQHTVGVSLDDGIKDTYHLQAKDVAAAVAKTNLDGNGGDATSLDTRSMKLQGKCSLVLQDLHQNGLKFDDHISESSLEEMFKEHADVSSKRLPCDDYSDLDLLHRLSGSFNGESSGNNSHVKQGNAVISSYQNPKDAEAKAVQKINVIEKEEDAQSSPTCDLAETSTIQGPQVKLYNGQFDSESWNEQILEPKSTHHAVVVKDTEEVLSSSENFLADVSTYDQKVEPHNDNMDVTCCHATHDQVSELKYVHQTDNMEEEGISSLSHHVAELRTSPEENFELHRDQIDLESSYDQVSQSTSAQHIDFFENATDSMSPPTHHHAELGATLEQKDEAPRDNQPDMKSWHDQSFEPEHVQQIEATGSLETAPSSDIYYITELTTHIDQTCRLEEHFDENSRPTNNANMVPLSLMLEGESLTPNNPESETYPSSEVSARHLPSQPSLFVSQFSVPKPAEDPLSSKVSAFGCLPKASLEEIPPLLPLPPHAIPGPEESLLKHNLHSVPKSVSSNEAKSPSGHPATEAEDSHPSNPFSRNFSFENNNSQDMNVNEADNLVPSVNPLLRPVPELVEIASRMPDTPQDLVLPVHHCLKCEDVLLDSNEGILEQDVKLFSPPTTVEESPSALPFCSFSEKTVEPLNQSAPSTSSNLDDKIQGEPIVSEEKNVNCPTTDVSVPVIHVYEKQPVLSTSGEKATWTSSSSLSLASSKDGMENGNEKIKLPRPRNPLIDAVVAHDKSKLRKVTQLPQPLIGKKAEERDSLLEQIRAKSFNLKPAVVTRPSIQGPETNLRLAAILEKANAIRQAFAGNGSDEDDDEDGWSDS